MFPLFPDTKRLKQNGLSISQRFPDFLIWFHLFAFSPLLSYWIRIDVYKRSFPLFDSFCYFWPKNEEGIWPNPCPMVKLHCKVKEQKIKPFIIIPSGLLEGRSWEVAGIWESRCTCFVFIRHQKGYTETTDCGQCMTVTGRSLGLKPRSPACSWNRSLTPPSFIFL